MGLGVAEARRHIRTSANYESANRLGPKHKNEAENQGAYYREKELRRMEVAHASRPKTATRPAR